MIIFILIIWLVLYLFKGFCFANFIGLSLVWFLCLPFAIVPKIVLYLIFLLITFISSLFIIKKGNIFAIFFGLPGSGKSTFATYLSKKYNRKKKRVFANFKLKGAIEYEKSDIGVIDMSNCLLIIDEAGLDFNNRNFSKNFTPEQLRFFKYHRKYNCDIVVFSQSHDDMDSKLRALANRLYYLKKSLIPYFICRRSIVKKIAIDKNTHQIIDAYSFLPFSGFYIFMPSTWKYFDSFERPKLKKIG